MAAPKKFSLKRAANLYRDGIPVVQIAKRYGVCTKSIYEALKAQNVVMSRRLADIEVPAFYRRVEAEFVGGDALGANLVSTGTTAVHAFQQSWTVEKMAVEAVRRLAGRHDGWVGGVVEVELRFPIGAPKRFRVQTGYVLSVSVEEAR